MVLGGVALYSIPKESSPAVKLGIISIVTSYFGTSPVDMDSLISEKIYKEVKDIAWVDSIDTSSSLGISSVTLTLKSDADPKDVINDVRNRVNRVVLPSDAKTPVITEIETDTKRAFSVYIYWTDPNLSKALLMSRAIELQGRIEELPGIDSVDLWASSDGGPVSAGWGGEWAYDVEIIVPRDKIENLGLTLASIAGTIQSYNRDQPIGNYAVGEKKYDFRIEGKTRESYAFLDIPLALPTGGTIRLWDIATIERKYKSDAVKKILLWTGETAYPYVGITINKTDSASIFAASDRAKEIVEKSFSETNFSWYGYIYAVDLADTIRDDYDDLLHEALVTLALVFVAMYLFVGFKDSIFATITLPLAFLATFLLLYYGGYTLNFLTNFSLILSFGIAVDTIIVIVQAASAKLRVGYEPRTAIMLALREYAIPIISGVMTTIVVFIPMMTLPGILGKFLAYIPITIFWVLASGLVLALTVNSALYLLFVKNRKSYVDDPHAIEYADEEEKELLQIEREGKVKIEEWKAPLRIRVIHSVTNWYKRVLTNFLEHTFLRRLSIIVPVILLILSFKFLAPLVGFELFPGDDNALVSFRIEWPVGQKTLKTAEDMKGIEKAFIGYPELKHATYSVNGNGVDVSVQLTKKNERKLKWQRSVYEIEKLVLADLQKFAEKWYTVNSVVQENGPPGGKAIGLKLIASKTEELPTLIQVSKDFEAYLKKLPGAKNVARSSEDTPGQFIYTLKRDLIAERWLSAAQIYAQITQNINGVTVASIEDNGQDMNIILKTSQFQDEIKPEDILAIPLQVWPISYVVWDFVEVKLTNATARVAREDGKIQITVDGDLEQGIDTVTMQRQYEEFAKSYPYPPGISYAQWGENAENSELIVAMLSAFFIALIVIFAILTLQFNSFSQPLIVLFSVIMALPFVMVGLLLTDNQFSMPFGIGFIAFTGIAVNHGIILIDAINQNLKKWMEGITALVEAGSSRLEPMLLTTVTTALGILPIALRDRFWSGMGFTIIFGIIAASALTLFVVKGIYYEIYVSEHEGPITKIKKFFSKRKMRELIQK
jgi:multidrug efflux pump subunit AcrB